jgi:hypothetical protein
LADKFDSILDALSQRLLGINYSAVVALFQKIFPGVNLPGVDWTQWADRDSRRKFLFDAALQSISSDEVYTAFIALCFTLPEILRAAFISGVHQLPAADSGGRLPSNRKEKIKERFWQFRADGKTPSKAALVTARRYQTTRDTVLHYVNENPLEAHVLEIRRMLREQVRADFPSGDSETK